MADSIFSDRIRLWSRLRTLEAALYDGRVSGQIVREYLEGSIRLELCFAELRNFNNRGTFLGRHPFIAQGSERDRLKRLLVTDPVAFTEEMHRVRLNISRYQSHAKSGRYTDEQKARELANLEKFNGLLATYEEILKEYVNGSR